MKQLFFVFFFVLFVSCGDKTKLVPKKDVFYGHVSLPEVNGIYRAELTPLNDVIDGGLKGSATVARERDEFVVDVYVSGARPKVFHPQNIHFGTRCPDERDDLNRDGFIDIEEAYRVVDKILIPIDEDITTQWLGLGTYPITDEFGSYYWAKATSYKKLLEDLHEEDINLDDDIAKIPSDEFLSIEGRVVLILGASLEEELPDTVAGRKRLSPHQSIPIACGIFKKVEGIPGKIEHDDPVIISEADSPATPQH